MAAYYRASTRDPWRIVIVPAAGGDPFVFSDLPLEGFGLKWTPDGKSLSFSCAPRGVQNICVVPRTGGLARQVTEFTQGTVGSHDWSGGGRLLVVRTRVMTDLVEVAVRENR